MLGWILFGVLFSFILIGMIGSSVDEARKKKKQPNSGPTTKTQSGDNRQTINIQSENGKPINITITITKKEARDA